MTAQPRARWRNLRPISFVWFVALIVCVVAACGADVPSQALREPWDSPENVRRASLSSRPTHSESGGFAVAADGRTAAVAMQGSFVNELLVVNLAGGSATRIVGHSNRVMLAHPALSADGLELAMIATPPSYFGIGEVWVVNLLSERVVRIADGSVGVAYPTFSPDGSRMLYFREVAPTASPQLRMRPEYRAFVDYGLAEYSFDDNRNSIVSSDLVRRPCGLSYASMEGRAVICAGEWVGPRSAETARRLPENIGGTSTFEVIWSAEGSTMRALSFGALSSFEDARFQQVLPDGSMLFSVVERSGDRRIFPPPLIVSHHAAQSQRRYLFPNLAGLRLISPRFIADQAAVIALEHDVRSGQRVVSNIVVSRLDAPIRRIELEHIPVVRTIFLNVEFGG